MPMDDQAVQNLTLQFERLAASSTSQASTIQIPRDESCSWPAHTTTATGLGNMGITWAEIAVAVALTNGSQFALILLYMDDVLLVGHAELCEYVIIFL